LSEKKAATSKQALALNSQADVMNEKLLPQTFQAEPLNR